MNSQELWASFLMQPLDVALCVALKTCKAVDLTRLERPPICEKVRETCGAVRLAVASLIEQVMEFQESQR